jgi:hypothetical protein
LRIRTTADASSVLIAKFPVTPFAGTTGYKNSFRQRLWEAHISRDEYPDLF